MDYETYVLYSESEFEGVEEVWEGCEALFATNRIQPSFWKNNAICSIYKGKVVGCLAFTSVCGDAIEFDLCVDENHRQRGIASNMLAMLEDEWETIKEAYGDIHLYADCINPLMVTILEHRGYYVQETRPHRKIMVKDP